MKAVLLVVLLLGLSHVYGQAVTPIVNGADNPGLADNCQPQYWRLDATTLSPQSYLFVNLRDTDLTGGRDVQIWVGFGYQPSATKSDYNCIDTVNNKCTIEVRCPFKNQIIYFTTMKGPADQTNNSVPFNFSATVTAVSITDLVGLANLPTRRQGGIVTTGTPTPPNYDHYKVAVTIGPAAVGSDLVFNLTSIVGSVGTVPALVYTININQYSDNDDGTTCAMFTCTQQGGQDYCAITIPYCTVTAGTYYLAVTRVGDGTNYYNYTINAYWTSYTIIPLTPGVPKYGQAWAAGIETYYTFPSAGPNDEVSVSVYDVAGGTLHWQASQNYLWRYSATTGTTSNCAVSMQCLTAYGDSCRDQYHYCPTPAAGTTTNWYVMVRVDTLTTSIRNRDIISWVIVANVKPRQTVTLNNPQFAITGSVPQENYDYYSFVVPASITNQTFYIELYIDNTDDQANLYRNYLMDGSTYAGQLLKNGNTKCVDNDWSCSTAHATNQRCFMQIPTCKLTPGSTIYWSVYGVKSQYYGIPVSYTLFGGLSTPMLLKDGISYQDSTNTNTYVHYKYHYDVTDFTPGDALKIEVSNIKASTKTNVYLNFRNLLAGDCPCYSYDYVCNNVNTECLFDTFTLFGGAGCRGLVPQDIYLSVFGVQDAGLPNIGYTVTITKYNWAGPLTTLVADTLNYAYVSDQEYNYYVLDSSPVSIANPIMTFHVRFVEYEAANDNEQLTMYVMSDNLLTPTCAPYVCTTTKFAGTPDPYSYCEVRLNPCNFDKTKTWYVVIYGTGGANKARPIHYTITAKSGALTPIALTNMVPMPGQIVVRQVTHYTYAVANTNNNRLYVEMYMDKDWARSVNFKVNFGYPASASPCYNYTSQCTVITDYTTKCVYTIPNCQLQVGTYYFGVEALDDFYHQPAPYTITVYEKPEILNLIDATSPNGGPIWMTVQRGEYQVFKFDATQNQPGDIFYLEVDNVEGGAVGGGVDVVISADAPKGYCPCYTPIGALKVQTTVTTYFMYTLACAGVRNFYMYVAPHSPSPNFNNEKAISYSAAVYINKQPAATTLSPGLANGVNQTVITSQYTHNYYMIAQNPAKAQSTLVVNFGTNNSTLPQFAVLYGRAGGIINDLCSAGAPLCAANTQNCTNLIINPCGHRIDQGNYYFDVTATTNVSYVYQLWYTWVDPIPLPTANNGVSGTLGGVANINSYFTFTAPMIAGSILQLSVTAFTGANPATVQYAPGSLFGSYCDCTATPSSGSVSNGADLNVFIPYCTTGVGSVTYFVTVQATGSNGGTFTILWNVLNVPVKPLLVSGAAGTAQSVDWLNTPNTYKVYTMTLPSNMATLKPSFVINPGWSNTEYDFSTGMGFIPLDAQFGGACTAGQSCQTNGACSIEECCVDSSHGKTWYAVVHKNTATNTTFTMTATLANRVSQYTLVPGTPKTTTVLIDLTSNNFLNNIAPGTLVDVLFYNTNNTNQVSVWQNTNSFLPATSGTVFPCWGGSSQICTSGGGFTNLVNCTVKFNCPNTNYNFGVYNDIGSQDLQYSIMVTTFNPIQLVLNNVYNGTVSAPYVNRPIQYYVDVPATFNDKLYKLQFIISEISNPGTTTVTAYTNRGGPVLNTGVGDCSGGASSICDNQQGNTSQCMAPGAPPTVPSVSGCSPNAGAQRWYIAVVCSAVGNYNIRPLLVLSPTRTTLSTGLTTWTNLVPPQYYVFPWSGQLSTIDITFTSVNPITLQANAYIGDSCTSATTLHVDGTRDRLYPCTLFKSPSTNVYLEALNSATASNWTWNIATAPLTVIPLSIGTTTGTIADKDALYVYYSLALPVMTEGQQVTVSISTSCGTIYVVEDYNKIAYPEAFPPTTGTGCWLNKYDTTGGAVTPGPYTYCAWKDRNDRTIYYTLVGETRPYGYPLSYSITVALTGSVSVPELPFRQEFLHSSTLSPNGLYWFDTQTESVGTQIYFLTHGATNTALSGLTNEWYSDSGCAYTDQVVQNELTTLAQPNFQPSLCTNDPINAGYQYCYYEIYPGEYRDGRYYLQLNAQAMAARFRDLCLGRETRCLVDQPELGRLCFFGLAKGVSILCHRYCRPELCDHHRLERHLRSSLALVARI